MQAGKAKLLRLYLSEQDKYQGKPLHEAVVEKCHELSIAGATVFKGVEGYGETAEMHRSHLLSHDQPIEIMIVDTDEKIQSLRPILEEMLDTGLIVASDVEMKRVSAAPPASTE
jgi:PII-like signaling protein